MPRCARIKSNSAIYHVMAKSISEVPLLETEAQKYKYISIVKEYKNLYKFEVFGYCFMDNHVHLIIYANGADISKIMHCINFKYAQWFNKTNNRHGHLFQDRFKSKIVDNERYLYALSAYIHNNPTDISGYKNCPEKYIFSSLGVYIGLRKDPFDIVDAKFVIGLFGGNTAKGRRKYMNFVRKCNDFNDKKEFEFEDDKTESRNEKMLLVRDVAPEEVIQYIVDTMKVSKQRLLSKFTRGIIKMKALLVFLLRCLCDFKCSDICKIFGNITQSQISKYCRLGFELYDKYENYQQTIEVFIERYANN